MYLISVRMCEAIQGPPSNFFPRRVFGVLRPLRILRLEGWKNERIENGEGIEKKGDLGVKRWRDEKLFCVAEEKSERMEKVVCINVLLCPYYIIYKK